MSIVTYNGHVPFAQASGRTPISQRLDMTRFKKRRARSPVPSCIAELIIRHHVDEDIAGVVCCASEQVVWAFSRVDDNSEISEYVTGPTVKS